MSEQRYIDVMLCVNDANGNKGKFIELLEIPDFITLEGGDKFKLYEATFSIGQNGYPFHSYNTHVGNIAWDCAWVSRDVAAMLLNILKKSGDWDIQEGESKIWEKWKSGKFFIPQDFR